MKAYRCPVCKKPLTKAEFDQAMGIVKARNNAVERTVKELKKQLDEAKKNVDNARTEGEQAERRRTRTLLKGKNELIQTLKDRVEQLQKGTTPQTEGLDDENVLVKRLKHQFPEDDIQHKGKGGDVLQIVKYEKKDVGVIIYECKRTRRIQSQHVRQAYKAKQTRHADFAVLVTTGKKQGFGGYAEMSGVLVVSPLGTLHLAVLLRMHLIQMVRAEIDQEQRRVIAQQLVKYITSPQFRNPIQQAMQTAGQLQDMVRDEAVEHMRTWNKRMKHYQTINWDCSQVQQNLELVLSGQEPKEINPPQATPLQLPASTE